VDSAAADTIDRRYLHEIISTVSSSLELEQVLAAIARLLSDASAVHACFIYLLEDDGERLVLRGASDPYGQIAGSIALARGEGLAWWAIERREPAFIREGAQRDPRFKYVPELEEDRFQSLVSVPMLGRDSAPIGTITLHTEAPREFSESEVELLSSSGALVAGVVENARLYADARRRVAELEHLAELSAAVASATTLEDLLPVVAERTRALLGASACLVYLARPAGDQLELLVAAPAEARDGARATIGLSDLGPELARGGRHAALAVPLVVDGDLLGLLRAQDSEAVDLARAAANQIGVAIRKIEVIEELLEKNLIRDFFEALASRHAVGTAVQRAARLGCDLERAHVVLIAASAGDPLERRLKAAFPAALVDRHADTLRALLPVAAGGSARLLAEVRRMHAAIADAPALGLSSPCAGAASYPGGFEEARYALVGAAVLPSQPTVVSYEELGVYQYLLRMAVDPGMRDPHRDALALLLDYDQRHHTALLSTLEEFLLRRGSISATSEALFIHPNTLRQRLRRIAEVTGIDLARDDWLVLELALKLLRLQRVLGDDAHTPPARGM